jgi:N-methylhydantoinase A
VAPHGRRDCITMDMGGTSFDAALVCGGEPLVMLDGVVDRWRLALPMIDIHTIGAGGGSIAWLDEGGMLHVGPESAGAQPGPACYGRGGTAPTLTDACLLMGILDPGGFAGGEMRLDPALARRAFEALDTPLSLEQRVSFAYRIAVANIAEEVTNVAVRHGVDPRDFTLVAYGAAGPMLLPAALDLLQVARIVIPPHPGLFSAMGLLSTDLVYYESRSAYVVLSPESAAQVEEGYQQRERALRERLGAADDGVAARRSLDGRLLGQSWATPFVEVGDEAITAETMPALVERFHEAYERRYGNRFPYVPVQGVTYRVQLVVPADKIEHVAREAGDGAAPAPARTIGLHHLSDEPLGAGEYERESLAVGAVVQGPAVIREALSTTFVMPGQVAEVGRFGEISIEQHA